jgi:hypothetical protein
LLRLLAAAAQPKAAASNSTLFVRTVGRFCRYNTLKNLTDAASKASPEQCLRSAGKRANFSAAKNLPFSIFKAQKIKEQTEKVVKIFSLTMSMLQDIL